MGTLIVEVRKALVDGLSGVAEFQSPSTITGQRARFDYAPRRDAKERERVWTENSTVSQSSASMRAGKTFRNELGTFDVAILVSGVTKDLWTTSSRAVEIARGVEDYVATHINWMSWGLDGLNTLTVDGDWTLSDGAFEDGKTVAAVAIPIRYTARIE